MEVGENIASLHILGDELEFAEGSLGIVVVLQISQRDFKHATLQTVRSDTSSLRTVDQGLANLARSEHRWSFDIIPILAGEWIDDLLLGSLFA